MPQTGVYDERTRKQVKTSSALRLEPDGIVGEKTWDKIWTPTTGIFDSVRAIILPGRNSG